MAKKNGLGKGFGALVNTDVVLDTVLDDKNIIEIKISQIEPNKDQPRTVFDEEKLSLLSKDCLVIDLASKPGGADFPRG